MGGLCIRFNHVQQDLYLHRHPKFVSYCVTDENKSIYFVITNRCFYLLILLHNFYVNLFERSIHRAVSIMHKFHDFEGNVLRYCLVFIIPVENYFSIIQSSPLSVEGWKFGPMLGFRVHRALKFLYRATPFVTRDIRL